MPFRERRSCEPVGAVSPVVAIGGVVEGDEGFEVGVFAEGETEFVQVVSPDTRARL